MQLFSADATKFSNLKKKNFGDKKLKKNTLKCCSEILFEVIAAKKAQIEIFL